MNYSYAVSQAARNVAKMLSQSPHGPTVDVVQQVRLVATQSVANECVELFKKWYAVSYPEENIKLFMLSGIVHKPPLMVAGLLSEFANFVNEVVDVSNILDTAAGAVKRYGWVQGKGGSCENGFCLLAAVDYALTKASANERIYQAREALWKTVKNVLREELGTCLLIQWNDEPSRTKDEVIELLHQSATAVRTINL